MPESHILIPHGALAAFCRTLLEAADLVADSLVAANLRGVDSHGVLSLPFYIRQIQAGNASATAQGRVVSESGACLLYDGERALGQVTAGECCRHALRLALGHGIAMVTARNSGHFGAAAFWAQRISREGSIGIALTNASPLVAPWQGREGRFGTNPICVSVPGERVWLLDMATTTVAMGKVLKAHLSGDAAIPPGWSLNSEGVPTTDTREAMRGFLMPLGGYKGSGLAMMVEILTAVLGGGAMSTEVGGMRLFDRPMGTSHAFFAIDVARFLPADEFTGRMSALRERAKSARPAAGYDEVLVAGEPEWRIEDERLASGIPISQGIWNTLRDTAARLGVAPPEPGAAAPDPVQ
jgi:LDH2 family malate/lactate/ureidoglycolate dehydrogenase